MIGRRRANAAVFRPKPMWEPISREELDSLLRESLRELDPAQTRLWRAVAIPPEKWIQHPWGDEGGGFWVVGLIGLNVIWYNDIEDGFNIGAYSTYGTIDDYSCEQSSLLPVLYDLSKWLIAGEMRDVRAGPPEPLSDL